MQSVILLNVLASRKWVLVKVDEINFRFCCKNLFCFFSQPWGEIKTNKIEHPIETSIPINDR
jgi:hypothetical protein